jgi:hypothetical protein
LCHCTTTRRDGFGKKSLGAKDGEDHTKNKLATLETLVESILKNIELLCTLRNQKKDIGGKDKLAPTIVVEVIGKGTHQEMTCCTQIVHKTDGCLIFYEK